MADPRYETSSRHVRFLDAHPPPRRQIHDGYYSDEERPSRPRSRFTSREARIPSPPTVSTAPRYGFSARAIVPSPPKRDRRRRESATRHDDMARSSREARVPSPPPSPRRMSPRENQRLTGLPVRSSARAETRYLSPLDGAEAISSRAQGVRRSNSDRGPRPRPHIVIDAAPMERAASKGSAASLSPSTTTTTLTSASGVLGDRAYQYRPLGESQFRLVRIHPAKKTMVQCEIIHASLQSPPRYVALSYAWGDAGDTRKIELEASLIPIGVNLHGALEALRQKTEPVLVWADALCIDQQNEDERALQIRLMTNIYSMADSVAVWLGPEEDDSATATEFLRTIANQASSPERLSHLLTSQVAKHDLATVVSLFDRDYWRRLWVVQEIFNARSITVYCGKTKLPWVVYQTASDIFARHRNDLDRYFQASKREKRRSNISTSQFSYSQVLVYEGPGGLPDLRQYTDRNSRDRKDDVLLEVLRACRRKLASDPKDKLFGILGVLPEEVRNVFRAGYSRSVKDVYTEIVDHLVQTTERLDVICDAIHFPLHSNSSSLPSYVPDWSHVPQTTALCHKFSFSAAGSTKAECRFLDQRLNKLEISAIFLDTIDIHGMAVGTLCKLGDYLMAFLHWRALLLGNIQDQTDELKVAIQEEFCRTLSLGQVPPGYRHSQWMNACYRVFASLLRERLPYMPLPRDLYDYLDGKVDCGPEPKEPRQFLQMHFGDRMMGRCFCYTTGGRIGMGTGFMLPGDIVVVPLGCSTPILLRPEGIRGEYRFVGDVYIYGYMYGRAVEHWKEGKWDLKKYVLH